MKNRLMNQYDLLAQQAPKIEKKLNYTFKDRSLLALAFVHRSFINENKTFHEYNERLEFLGDSVLGLMVSDYIYKRLPHTPEGELSYLRSRLVEATSCMKYMQTLDVSSYLVLGKGEQMNDGRGRESILADLFEAIIGAIYLDGGLQAAQRFFFDQFHLQIEAILTTPLHNWKALLQDYCQKNYQTAPMYKVLEEQGPDHSKMFRICVLIQNRELGEGSGASKKEAQQAAAADAFSRLQSKKN